MLLEFATALRFYLLKCKPKPPAGSRKVVFA
jgi:hypothetical protein